MKGSLVLLILALCFTTTAFSHVKFTSHTITTDADGTSSVYAVDVNGDGDMDVLSASTINLSEAKERYSPCSVCKPPTSKVGKEAEGF